MALRVSNLRLSVDVGETALPSLLSNTLGVPLADLHDWRILRKSLDVRDKRDLRFVYNAEVRLPADAESRVLKRAAYSSSRIEAFDEPPFEMPPPGTEPLRHRPVVIGSGPAGLVAGYFLAEMGYQPLVLERGAPVHERIRDVKTFDDGGHFEPESNYLFGEGGAGTFSDGKLTCRNTGPDVMRVLKLFADCKGQQPGKPSILYFHRPHLGSNRLPAVVKAIRQRIESLGGEVRFKSRVEDLVFQDGKLKGVVTSCGEIPAELAVVATFCMCAGGYVIPSVSQEGYFATNGMSLSKRDSPYANSGLVVTLPLSEFGSNDPLAGMRIQELYEKKAFELGRGRYACPVQRATDFMNWQASPAVPDSSYPREKIAIDLAEVLPPYIWKALQSGLPRMDAMWRGKFMRDAVLVGPESRGSSPVRIPRDEETREAPGIVGIYPTGEGAGYAGGIVSAAVDGLKTAKAIVARYAPLRK